MLNYTKIHEIEKMDFTPDKIIQRTEEKGVLEDWAKDEYKDNLLIISQDAGTGKTSIMKWFLKNRLPDYKKVYVLCRKTETNHETLKAIGELLSAETGMEMQYKKTHHDVMKYLEKVLEKGHKIVICLDELDYLIDNEKNDNFLCSLLHLQKEKPNGELVFVLISNDYYIRNKFSYITLSRLNELMLHFNPYKTGESAEILKYYIRDFGLLQKEYVPENAVLMPLLLNFIKQLAIGDMRKIMLSFIKWAKKCKTGLDLSVLSDKFFDDVLKEEIVMSIENMGNEEKLILLGLLKSEIDCTDYKEDVESGKKLKRKFYKTTFERLYRYYKEVCFRTKTAPLKIRRFKFYLYRLIERRRMIDVCKTGRGRGKGMYGIYVLNDFLEKYNSEIIEKLLKELNISKEYFYNTNQSMMMTSKDYTM